jgi:hypothetical protein
MPMLVDGPETLVVLSSSPVSIDPVPIRECTSLIVDGNSLICLAHRVRAEGGNALSDR